LDIFEKGHKKAGDAFYNKTGKVTFIYFSISRKKPSKLSSQLALRPQHNGPSTD